MLSLLVAVVCTALSARAALPEVKGGAFLGPSGVRSLALVDLPDLQLVLQPSTGMLHLWSPSHPAGGVSDGAWPASTTMAMAPMGDARWVATDAAGRVTRITWASGRRCLVERDQQGRVTAVLGPGPARKRISYEGGVQVEDTLGTGASITSEDGRTWLVRDGAGRQVRLLMDPDGETVATWEDPRGLSTVVKRRLDVTEVIGPGGAVWRTGPGDAGGFVELPNGLRWLWTVDGDGRISRVVDPSGVQAEWRYDGAGRVVSAELDGRRTVVERDGEGRPLAVTDPSGATIRLRWEAGQVSQITDAAGATVVFERGPQGNVDALLTRSGGRWELQRDLDGRLRKVTDPVGRTMRLDHDGAGRLSLVEVHAASVRLERDSAGRITGVVDASGLRTGLVRDPTGRVRELRRPGSTVAMERDAAGEVVGVRAQGLEVVIQRDPAGRVLSAGPIAWTRDIMGWVDRLVAPGIDLLFSRDTVGRLQMVRAGDQILRVSRNSRGDPMQWTGAGLPVRVERDAAGRVMWEEVAGRRVRATRGIRGGIDRVEAPRGTWRWSRSADAAVLRVDGPDGVGVGADLDEAGRVTLARLPGGGLLRRAFDEGVVYEQLTDGGGEVVTRSTWAPDLYGNMARSESEDGVVRVWSTGPDGSLAAVDVEARPEDAWSFGEEVDRGPGGWLRARDRLGRTMEVMVTDTWPVWGAVGGAWTYVRGTAGAVAEVHGEATSFRLQHDGFGRLVGVHSEGGSWRVVWDAVGRPSRLERPFHRHDILWAPGQVAGTPLATGPDGSTAWMDTGSGARAWSEERVGGAPTRAGAVTLPGELTTRVEDALGLMPVKLGAGTGLSDTAALDPIGGRGGLILFSGGPELFLGGALDPVSSDRTDGTVDWPWMPQLERPRVRRGVWDPDSWAPVSEWGQPLVLASKLGLVNIPEPTGQETPSVAWSWLPDSLDRAPHAIGPPRGEVDLQAELEPIVYRVLEHLRDGEGPITGRAVLGPLVDPGEVGDLPPGLMLPGLGAPSKADFSRPSLSKKLVASWGGLL